MTKKRPVGRPPLNRNWDGPQAKPRPPRRFPRSAVLIFQRMLRLAADCTCKNHSCTACKQWWVEHRNLHRELELNPWDFPCVEAPGTPCPFPPGSRAAKTWEPDYEAQARWGRLFQACPRGPRRCAGQLIAARTRPAGDRSDGRGPPAVIR